MKNDTTRRLFLHRIGLLGLVPVASGCGTFLHPERMGQTRGQIDWRVAALNGAGLLLFFVPGVVAFAVDFYNGTIFLPPEEYQLSETEEPDLIPVDVSDGELDQDRIESVLSQHLQQPVTLDAKDLRTERLDHLDRFWRSVRRLG